MPDEGMKDPTVNGFEPRCGCWDLNLEPLKEQTVLVTTEPSSLQPLQPELVTETLFQRVMGRTGLLAYGRSK